MSAQDVQGHVVVYARRAGWAAWFRQGIYAPTEARSLVRRLRTRGELVLTRPLRNQAPEDVPMEIDVGQERPEEDMGVDIVAVGHEPGAVDPWVVYWTDGEQTAGCTLTERGSLAGTHDGGPGHDVQEGLDWGDLPEAVREGAVRQIIAWLNSDMGGDEPSPKGDERVEKLREARRLVGEVRTEIEDDHVATLSLCKAEDEIGDAVEALTPRGGA